jgi:hypothetical protein
MIKAYMKVVKTIQSAHYRHMINGSVNNLINNFGNMYNKNRQYNDLIILYNEKLKELKTN